MGALTDRATGVLAAIRFGSDPVARATEGELAFRIPNGALPPGPMDDVVPASGPVERKDVPGAVAAADGRSIFAAMESSAASDRDLEAHAFECYRQLLCGVEAAGYPNVVRMWNYVPRIHGTANGLDRYMRFCRGRSKAFAAHHGNEFAGRLPAASAVGCPGDTLVVHALATKHPVRHVENPRQMPAYRYPERYGPKSPSFARGTVAQGDRGGDLFVSGTASIVGHESVFPDDPARQTRETLRNIEAVLDAAGVSGRGRPLGPRLRSLRVYVRHPEQGDEILRELAAGLGAPVRTVWLQAEICRKELLVEIEATARTG